MDNNQFSLMSWNVRGLNSPARRAAVSELAAAHRTPILCLQETKLEAWSPSIVRELGGNRLDGCAVVPAVGTRGGAAILWDKSAVQIGTQAVGLFSITAKVTLLQCSSSF
ncbi:hypothetical protein VPH35_014061 [Triticum aestivum]